MDFADETVRGRLSRAVTSSYRSLRPFRELLRELVKEYAGPGYGRRDVRPEQYLNLLNQAVDAYTMPLAANTPKIMVTQRYPELGGFAFHYQTAVNNLLEEIRFGDTLRAWLLDAFFGLGVVKIHLADSGLVEIEQDVWMDPGIPYVSNVSLEDFVYDTTAKKVGHAKFFGDLYRVPYEDFQQMYPAELTKDISPTSKNFVDGERLEQFSRGQEVDEDEFEPMVDLCDIYIPRDRTVYTFHVKQRHDFAIFGPPLDAQEWVGTEFGPYRLFGFIDVPENIMPASFADQLSPLSRLTNNLMRKQARQAKRQKSLTTYTPQGTQDAKRIQRANDGDLVQVQDPESVRPYKTDGVDPSNNAFMLNGLELFDRMAGNLTAMLGLGSQAGTVGQEQLIHSAASRKETQMQTRWVDAIRTVIQDLALLLWQDGFKTIPAQYTIPGTNYTVDMTWQPGDREGQFPDYGFDVDVYSLSYQTPSQRLQGLTQVVTQIFAPLMPFLQQQGGTIDMQALAQIFAGMMSEPRIQDVVKFAAPPPQQQQGGDMQLDAVRKPVTGQREYIRRNVSSATPSSRMNEAWSNVPSAE